MILSNENFCRKIDYLFKNMALLDAALSHRSSRGNNNERLEFLGDSIINFVIAAALYNKCPEANEGELSQLRAILVKGETLAELAQEFELGNYLRLGAGELKSGGFRRKSILADAMEAVVGAIYIDAGFEVCRERILHWYASRLAAVASLPSQKDPKTRLQEYLQARKIAIPIYRVIMIAGEAHQQTFHVECVIDQLELVADGVGSSRRSAEQKAAEKLLAKLNA